MTTNNTASTHTVGLPKKSNPQYTRTHNAICQALVHLLDDYSFENITVQMILDATPVTRTTFYKHFHDKFEVAELLQEQFFAAYEEIVEKLKEEDVHDFAKIINRYFNKRREQVLALAKIHSERVDLKSNLEKYLQASYMQNNESAYAPISAQIYASAITAFSYYNITHPDSVEDARGSYNQAMLHAFLAIFNLQDDRFLSDYILKKLEH